MKMLFTFEGGPKDKRSACLEESHFPESYPESEFRWNGNAWGVGAYDPNGAMPEADRAVSVWHAHASRNGDEVRG